MFGSNSFARRRAYRLVLLGSHSNRWGRRGGAEFVSAMETIRVELVDDVNRVIRGAAKIYGFVASGLKIKEAVAHQLNRQGDQPELRSSRESAVLIQLRGRFDDDLHRRRDPTSAARAVWRRASWGSTCRKDALPRISATRLEEQRGMFEGSPGQGPLGAALCPDHGKSAKCGGGGHQYEFTCGPERSRADYCRLRDRETNGVPARYRHTSRAAGRQTGLANSEGLMRCGPTRLFDQCAAAIATICARYFRTLRGYDHLRKVGRSKREERRKRLSTGRCCSADEPGDHRESLCKNTINRRNGLRSPSLALHAAFTRRERLYFRPISRLGRLCECVYGKTVYSPPDLRSSPTTANGCALG